MQLLRRIPKSIVFLFWMTMLTGVLYPLVVTGMAQVAFGDGANGSLVSAGGQVRGSRLLAQEFISARFFRPRPSATGYAYTGAGGSNMAPTNAALDAAVKERDAAWRKAFGRPAPADMRYASGSGLDPDISLEAALDQVDSVSAARGFSALQKAELGDAIRLAAARKATIIGSPRLDVVELNARLETDSAFAASGE